MTQQFYSCRIWLYIQKKKTLIWKDICTLIGESDGTPLQYSCLENPVDGGAWWAAVYGVTQSWTRLKRLSSSSMHPNAPAALFTVAKIQNQPKYPSIVDG